MNSPRIGYINVAGLNRDKWAKLIPLVNDRSSTNRCNLPNPSRNLHTVQPSSGLEHLHGHFDILFIAETWYVDHDLHLAHPMTIVSSPILPRSSSSRHHGGLLALVSTSFRPLILSTHATST